MSPNQRKYSIHETKTHLSKIIQRVLKGEEIIVEKSGKPVAKLVPFKDPEKKRRLGKYRGQIQISPDFVDPVDPETFE